VVTRAVIFLGIVIVTPQGRDHAVTQASGLFQTRVRRAIEGLENLDGVGGGHV
jgi:hypothetical protein